MVISQPLGSIKLKNVSQVRVKRGAKRYEIVCYRNKVQDYRRGVEKDLDEVLQVHQVFVNVSKGEVASASDLEAAFGTTEVDKVIMEILEKGELQVGEKERQQQADELHNTILQLIASKTINPRTQKPYTPTIIEKLLNTIKFQYSSKPAKGQALDAIKILVEKQIVPIARAKMRIRVSDELETAAKYMEQLKELLTLDEETEVDGEWEVIGTIDPSDFRTIDAMVSDTKSGAVDVLALV